jgi:uncharacterized phage protein (TIGR01671 family)
VREILFRGKRTDNKQWVEGYYVLIGEENPNADIVTKSGFRIRVDHKSIGQYTGLIAKSGARVFEGDVVQVVYDTRRYGTYVVAMSKERGGWFPFACGDGCGCCECDVERAENCEIIGNVYDNPELLEKEDAEWVEM